MQGAGCDSVLPFEADLWEPVAMMRMAAIIALLAIGSGGCDDTTSPAEAVPVPPAPPPTPPPAPTPEAAPAVSRLPVGNLPVSLELPAGSRIEAHDLPTSTPMPAFHITTGTPGCVVAVVQVPRPQELDTYIEDSTLGGGEVITREVVDDGWNARARLGESIGGGLSTATFRTFGEQYFMCRHADHVEDADVAQCIENICATIRPLE